MRDDLVGRRLAADAGLGVAVAVEDVAREGHRLAHRAAEEVAGADAELLAGDVHAGELDRRVELHAVVVERADRIHDLPAELLELQRIVADEIRLQSRDRRLRRLPAAAHLAEADRGPRRSRPRRWCGRTVPSARRSAWRSGASSGTVTVVARRSVIFICCWPSFEPSCHPRESGDPVTTAESDQIHDIVYGIPLSSRLRRSAG